jgi:aspartyl-tRNA synthetase
MNTYGVDKPDLRYGMELVELTEVFKDTDFKVFKAPCVKALCVKGGASLTRSQIDAFTEEARKLGAGGLAYILYSDGEAKSPILKFMSEKEIADVKKLTGATEGDAVFFGADTREKVNKVLGQLRISFADHFGLKNDEEVALTWIIDFPFYEWDEKNKKLDFGHNPFSMPKGGLSALEGAKTDEEKLAIVADQYDMVMNGFEICSGAVRNYNPEIMYKVFNILGYNGVVDRRKSADLDKSRYRYAKTKDNVCAELDKLRVESV